MLAEYERSKTSMWPYYLRNAFTGVVTDIRLGDPIFDTLKQSQASISSRLEHRFNEAVTFHQNVRLGRVNFEGNGGTCSFTQGRTVLGSVTARW